MPALSALPALLPLFNALPGAHLLLSPDLLIEAVSDAYLAVTLTQRENLLGRYVFDAFPGNPQTPEAHGVRTLLASFRQVLATGQPHEMPPQRCDVPDPDHPGQFVERCWLPHNSPVLDAHGCVSQLLHTVVDITAALRDEAHLHDSHAREQTALAEAEHQRQQLHTLFAEAPAPIAILAGPDFVFQLANSASQRIFPGQGLVGNALLTAFPELADTPILPILNGVYSTGETFVVQEMPVMMARYAGGALEEIHFTATYQARRDEQGAVDGVMIFAYEVTDQVKARRGVEENREELRRFQFMADRVRDPFILMRADATFAYLNPKALEAWGYTADEALHLRVPDVDPIFQDDVFRQAFARAQQENIPPFETLHKRKDGYIFPVEVSMGGLLLSGQPHMLAIARDITEQKRTIDALRESEARFRTMADAAPSLMWAVHPDASVRYINRAFLNFVGLDDEQQYAALSWPSYVHPEERDLTAHALTSAIRNRALYSLEHRMRRHDGEYRWLLAQGGPSYYPNGELYGYVGSAIDITELKQANEQLTRANVDLDNFIYTASHDLKAPISNIEGLLHALTQQLSPTIQQAALVQPILDMIQGAVDRFKQTIDHLTDITKLQQEYTPTTEQVELTTVVEDVRLDLLPLIEETGAHLEIDVADCPAITFSAKNLRSVVYNLLSNALKYRHPDRVPHIRISCRCEASWLVLRVQDNGLDGVQQTKLFGMFRRLHTHVEGSGIGLYMVKKMVENVGGKIEVESQIGLGSTFFVSFPA
ncbi:PAS/PAC sensor signal transduction histidine kinase [Hymenobacter roseosalivarius DSM 11622]|uniref:histidine kinase n=1 Tax=Hymenobacter roseosalivarius DSM 11622 TaxID=645990 RepID=A0A1W1VWM2_9BACT|nr:PAS domain S-box protein [Hymenobacter roseosalivarius]SMB97765.1 PAS/PAC sensor signal transduction histidine kinase [Hymenobacter roseosalivarius DSM 11622]